jgi:type IV fimbrial biogenesis protein FimT
LMVTVTVLAILVGLATPSFRDFTRNNRVTALNNDLVTALNLARSEATRRSISVTLCPSKDGATCGAAADWATGWIVFQDPTATGVIASQDSVVQKWSQTAATMQVSTSSTYVRYQPTGMSDAAAEIDIDISYTGCQGNHLRHVQVGVVGTISTQLKSCT